MQKMGKNGQNWPKNGSKPKFFEKIFLLCLILVKLNPMEVATYVTTLKESLKLTYM